MFSAKSTATIPPPVTTTFVALISELLSDLDMTSISPADFTVASTICATVSEELLYIALPPVNFIPETSTCTFVISVFDLDSALTATLPFALSTVPFDILAFVLEAKSTSLIPTLPVPIPAVTVTLVSSRASAPIPFI